MKKNFIVKILVPICCLIIISLSIILPIVLIKPKKSDMKNYVQDLDYLETSSTILNPDQGFYRTACIKVTEESVEDKSYIIKDNFQLYHLRMDISRFSFANNQTQDLLLTENSLIGIENLINKFLNANKNIIIRFSYDPEFDGNIDKEPEIQIILSHISQICSVLNKYPKTITAIETGMIGPWGEMHSSEKANATIINQIIDKFLDETASSKIPILVRTPQMIYDYLNITLNDLPSYLINKEHKAFRLGLFNDGYLGSNSDLGTYDDRELETNWISKQTNHLPFGGEVTGTSSNLHDIDKCLDEMFLTNLSYLNYEWNDYIVQTKWQEQIYNSLCGNDKLFYGKNAYEYISAHLGYRYVLKKSTFSYSSEKDKLNVKLKLNNVGFGNLNRQKEMYIIFVKDGQISKRINVGKFDGKEEINFSVDIKKIKGKFDLHLEISDTINEESFYQIRFANNLWNETTKANLIGKINL